MSVIWETRAPAEPIRLTPEQQACPHDKVEYVGHSALFVCVGREVQGRDGEKQIEPGCGAEMVIPEFEEAVCRKCDE